MKFYQFVKNLRIEHELTQEEFGKSLGVSKSTVAMWETGARTPSRDKCFKMSQLYKVDFTELYIMTLEQNKGEEFIYDEETHTWEIVAHIPPKDPEKQAQKYYVNAQSKKIANKLMENSDYKVLFDAVADVPPEDIDKVAQMIKLMIQK